jgi:hypothetical protein
MRVSGSAEHTLGTERDDEESNFKVVAGDGKHKLAPGLLSIIDKKV